MAALYSIFLRSFANAFFMIQEDFKLASCKYLCLFRHYHIYFEQQETFFFK